MSVMPETASASTATTPRPAFTELLNSVLGEHNAPWLAANLRDPDTGEGGVVSRQTASEWVSGKRPARVTVKNCRALEALFGVHQSAWYIAAGVQVGLEPPRSGGFANLVHPAVDQYPFTIQAQLAAACEHYGRGAGLIK